MTSRARRYAWRGSVTHQEKVIRQTAIVIIRGSEANSTLTSLVIKYIVGSLSSMSPLSPSTIPPPTMIRTHRRSTEHSRDYTYSFVDHHPQTSAAAPRIVIDSHGTAHDPDFINNILGEQRELARRRAASLLKRQ